MTKTDHPDITETTFQSDIINSLDGFNIIFVDLAYEHVSSKDLNWKTQFPRKYRN